MTRQVRFVVGMAFGRWTMHHCCVVWFEVSSKILKLCRCKYAQRTTIYNYFRIAEHLQFQQKRSIWKRALTEAPSLSIYIYIYIYICVFCFELIFIHFMYLLIDFNWFYIKYIYIYIYMYLYMQREIGACICNCYLCLFLTSDRDESIAITKLA